MKTPEDEAFDDLAKRQGDWGGGFEAKRKAAMDKINADFDEEYIKYRTAFPKREAALDRILQEQLRMGVYGSVPQPAQEPERDMPHGWVVNWPSPNGGTKPVYHASAIKPKFGEELDGKLTMYPVFTRTTPPQRPWVGLTNDERKALERFVETCDDGEGYDVPKQMMQRLAQIGVVHHTSGGVYSTTEFGRWVIDADPPQRERVVFPTMLRKMWSGGEVQAWLDENVNKEQNNG